MVFTQISNEWTICAKKLLQSNLCMVFCPFLFINSPDILYKWKFNVKFVTITAQVVTYSEKYNLILAHVSAAISCFFSWFLYKVTGPKGLHP